ncbi:MAG: rhodanese family protein [Planctomyces sp.]|nr:rhodanese family protein [Planctomyces sp.]MBA4120411.1 rhodanese family protein [Isosphaera sp.]
MKHSKSIRIAACAAVSWALVGCGSPQPTAQWSAQDPAAQSARSADSLIEAADIAAAIRAAGDDLAIFDVRPEAEYAAGHLPGAVRVDPAQWEELSLSADSGLTHEQVWHDRIGSLGVDSDDTVLVYDSGRMTQAARVWFILQHFGVAEARVVNGGFPLIAQAASAGQLALPTEPHEPRPAAFQPSATHAGRIGTLDRFQVRAAIESGQAQVLDARTVSEYRGVDLRKNDRGGHLPTAMNVPHTALLDAQGRLKPSDELAAILAEAGFVKGRPVITHCDSGGRAALASLAAARAGYGPVVNYYLSFGDWAKDATCPVETP